MAKEIWADNIEYRPELYSISSYGRIKNKKTNGSIIKRDLESPDANS